MKSLFNTTKELSETKQQANHTICDIIIVDVIIFAVLFIVLVRLIRLTVVDKLTRVNESLDKVTKGHLEERFDVRDSLEFYVLSDDITMLCIRFL